MLQFESSKKEVQMMKRVALQQLRGTMGGMVDDRCGAILVSMYAAFACGQVEIAAGLGVAYWMLGC
jgi:hypothetical protein